jgi:hypothetical protein
MRVTSRITLACDSPPGEEIFVNFTFNPVATVLALGGVYLLATGETAWGAGLVGVAAITSAFDAASSIHHELSDRLKDMEDKLEEIEDVLRRMRRDLLP